MMTGHRRKVLFAAAVFTTIAALTTGLGPANAAVGPSGSGIGPHPDVRQARHATAAYHEVEAAESDGYTAVVTDLSGATCIDEPGAGAMGIHYLNPVLLDGAVDPAAPEVIVYEPRRDGSLKLVAVEYLTFKADWEDAGNTEPPVLFGQTFDLVAEPNRYGIPDFYALHAWIWKSNPSGMFAMWNPKVKC